jgi:protein TonB
VLFFCGIFFVFTKAKHKNFIVVKNLKKLPTKQLGKFSNIFTQLGLVLVLFVVYLLLEHKTEQKKVMDYDFSCLPSMAYVALNTEVLFRKEPKIVPKTVILKNKVFIFDAPIEKGKEEDKETILEVPKNTPTVVKIGDILVVDIPEDDPIIEDVPFINIENAPIFKGCEGLSKKENKRCFDSKMKQFVQRNFNVDLANELGLHAGVHKIQTQFLIDEKGHVTDIKIRAPRKRLKKETQILIQKLSKFTQGKQQNRTVGVRYTLPIAFSAE